MISRILGLAGMVGCLAVVYFFETSSSATGIWRLFHWPAITLTGLGPLALVFLCFDFTLVMKTIYIAVFRSPSRLLKKSRKEALFLHGLGKQYYENGVSAFESTKTRGLSPFVKRIIDRLAVRIPPEDVRELSLLERSRIDSDLSQVVNVASSAVKLTPSIGMLGTIMGMVSLLSTLEDPTHIGSHMSLALLTTFYGLFFSIVVWTPIQGKLEKILSFEVDSCDQALRWLDMVEKRKPVTHFADSESIPKPKMASGK